MFKMIAEEEILLDYGVHIQRGDGEIRGLDCAQHGLHGWQQWHYYAITMRWFSCARQMYFFLYHELYVGRELRMKILVLGGTGAMGIPVVKLLADKENEVYVTTRNLSAMSHGKIHYITGNAQNVNFVKNILTQRFDVIIDFMIYNSTMFRERMELFLANTGQYFFLSSARVYADAGEQLITEDFPRLLNVIQDKVYLKRDEYALAKAREEDMLHGSKYKNWTIIRPYITYNEHRLQLGALEKEAWLLRALEGKKIVFSRDMARCYTTLTYGGDVALRIVALAGREDALGQTFQIAGSESVRWERVLEIYLDVLEEKIGRRPEVYWLEDAGVIAKACHNTYQIKYDRLFDRKFDSTKVEEFLEDESEYREMAEGLRKCLSDFLDGEHIFLKRNWRLEGAFDRLTGEHTDIRKVSGWKKKIRYFQGYLQ